MERNQTTIIELLRKAHLTVYKEIERLNLRIAELESQGNLKEAKLLIFNRPTEPSLAPPTKTNVEFLNERQAAAYLNVSVALMRKWRLFRQGPKFYKIGRLVRCKRVDLESWFDSCSE